MKRIVFALVVLACISACTKDNLDMSDIASSDIPATPSSFGQNILIENFTQTYCGQCPSAHLLLDSLMADHPGRVFGAGIHVMDLLSVPSITDSATGANALNDYFNITNIFPSGMVNRNITGAGDLSPGGWTSKVNTQLGWAPKCGIAIDANDINNGFLNLSVHVGFSDNMPGAYRLHVYIVEDVYQTADTLYAQYNDFSEFGSTPDITSPLFSYPPVINSYPHHDVLMRIVSGGSIDGDVIPTAAAIKGNTYIKSYIVNLAGINTAGSSIIAFVDKYGVDESTHRIENVQKAPIGGVASWN